MFFKFITPVSAMFIFFTMVYSQQTDLITKAIEKIEIPQSPESFNPLFHFPPVNQDTTSACWSFATASFFESEAKRLGFEPVKLAVMFPVYYGFIEKAKAFVKTKGKSRFAPGDLFTTVVEVVNKYGIVPEQNYRGQTRACSTYNHRSLYSELNQYIEKVKTDSIWDEELVLKTVTFILDKHLGKPPEQFNYDGKKYNPKTFAAEKLHLPFQDYILVTSFSYAPFYSFTTLDVPDNWQKITDYFNVPLEVFYNSLKGAVKKGYSVVIDGDFSEPGRDGLKDISIIPEFDIPAGAINQSARDFRFNNKSTTDDHLMHIVGYQQLNGQDWFLVKDSWRDAFEGKYKGYFFYHGDFVKLKVLAYMVNKEGVPQIVKRVKEIN